MSLSFTNFHTTWKMLVLSKGACLLFYEWSIFIRLMRYMYTFYTHHGSSMNKWWYLFSLYSKICIIILFNAYYTRIGRGLILSLRCEKNYLLETQRHVYTHTSVYVYKGVGVGEWGDKRKGEGEHFENAYMHYTLTTCM